MPRIHNKNRFKEIKEKRFFNYLIYAIGEIILIVIGILIALNLNIKNAQEKIKKSEIQIIENILEDLKLNSVELAQTENLNIKSARSLDIIIKNLDSVKVYHDSLDKYFNTIPYWSSPYLSISSYESLKTSKGIDLISNISLRKVIVSHFENHLKYYLGEAEREEWINTENITRPLFLRNFILDNTLPSNGVKPIDYQNLINNTYFINSIKFTYRLRKKHIRTTREFNDETKKLIELLKTEIKNLK